MGSCRDRVLSVPLMSQSNIEDTDMCNPFAVTTESITVTIRARNGGDIFEIPFTEGWTLFGLLREAFAFTGLTPSTAIVCVFRTDSVEG